MKHRSNRSAVLLAAMLSIVAALPATHALSFNVTTDTSALIGDPSGPFSLDFQLIDGAGIGDGNNTVEVSNFDFHGGGWVGGNPSPIVLTDMSFFSEFLQEFTPGTFLSFQVSMTTAVDAGPTPDQFSFAILDNLLFEIPTVGVGDALVSVDINSANPPVATFGTDSGRTSIAIPGPIVAGVPDGDITIPSLVVVATMIGGAGVRRRVGA
jgi:hypothetical protein